MNSFELAELAAAEAKAELSRKQEALNQSRRNLRMRLSAQKKKAEEKTQAERLERLQASERRKAAMKPRIPRQSLDGASTARRVSRSGEASSPAKDPSQGPRISRISSEEAMNRLLAYKRMAVLR